MAKWRFMRTGVGPFAYAGLGFSANEGDVLDADEAPDAYWVATGDGSPETVDRSPLVVDHTTAYYGFGDSDEVDKGVIVVPSCTSEYTPSSYTTISPYPNVEHVLFGGKDMVEITEEGVYSLDFELLFAAPLDGQTVLYTPTTKSLSIGVFSAHPNNSNYILPIVQTFGPLGDAVQARQVRHLAAGALIYPKVRQGWETGAPFDAELFYVEANIERLS